MDRRYFIKNSSVALLGTAITKPWPCQNDGSAIQMKYRKLGRTNMRISEISLGGSPIPSEAIFRRAIEMGVNYVDTSSSYMNGNSERTIGKIVREYPGKLYVATKIHAGRRGYTINDVEKEFEGSLKRLNMECVDILMVHGARTPDILENEEVLNLFEKYKREGKIRFTGVSCHRDPVGVLTPAIRSGNYDMITVAFNAFSGSLVDKDGVYKDYLHRSGIEGVINLAKKHDVGVVAMKTMAGGNRQNLTKFQKLGISLPQAKLKWVLQNKAVAAAISEMLTFEILEENLAASASPLTLKEKLALDHHVTSYYSDYCQMCGQCLKVCPHHIPIPDILRYALYFQEHRKTSLAKFKYNQLPVEIKYNNCNQCGLCLKACPSRLSIIKKLHSAHQLLV
jgi:predicted aldo/keto reductase-like oxidoreductase